VLATPRAVLPPGAAGVNVRRAAARRRRIRRPQAWLLDRRAAPSLGSFVYAALCLTRRASESARAAWVRSPQERARDSARGLECAAPRAVHANGARGSDSRHDCVISRDQDSIAPAARPFRVRMSKRLADPTHENRRYVKLTDETLAEAPNAPLPGFGPVAPAGYGSTWPSATSSSACSSTRRCCH
jgi:hypothetical protein